MKRLWMILLIAGLLLGAAAPAFAGTGLPVVGIPSLWTNHHTAFAGTDSITTTEDADTKTVAPPAPAAQSAAPSPSSPALEDSSIQTAPAAQPDHAGSSPSEAVAEEKPAEAIFSASSIPALDQRQSFYIDRGEFSRYLAQLYEGLTGHPLPTGSLTYPDDVPADRADILGLCALGLWEVQADGTFALNSTVTGEEAAHLVYGIITTADPMQKKDSDTALAFLQQCGIWPNGLSLTTPLTLGQAAAMLCATAKAAPDYAPVPSPPTGKTVYLTFDDGTSANTVTILDTLKAYGVPATFFVTGQADPALLQRMQAEGHAIGNHTASHDYAKIYQSVEAFFEDFQQEEDYLASVLGYRPTIVRLPGGSNNTVSKKYGGDTIMKEITAELLRRGYVYTDWNSEAKDASGKSMTPEQIQQAVFSTVGNRDQVIVLMHQNQGKESTAAALPGILEEFQARGYQFDVISDHSYLHPFLTP